MSLCSTRFVVIYACDDDERQREMFKLYMWHLLPSIGGVWFVKPNFIASVCDLKTDFMNFMAFLINATVDHIS